MPNRTISNRAAQSHSKYQRATDVITVLARLWPKTFYVYEGRRVPLKIGIGDDLIAQMEPAIRAGRISRQDIELALEIYTTNSAYQYALTRPCAARINLKGEIVGPVEPEHAARAQERLNKRRHRIAARTRREEQAAQLELPLHDVF